MTPEDEEYIFKVRKTFVNDLERGDQPSLKEAIHSCPASIRSTLFRTLLLKELEHRIRQDEMVDQSEYQELFPEYRALILTAFDSLPVISKSKSTDSATQPHSTFPSFSGYTVLKELGRGGCGSVYLAYDEKRGRDVALKHIHVHASPKEMIRFKQEATIISDLKNQGVVQVLDTGEINGTLFFTMEYLPGGTLANRSTDDFSVRDCVRIVRDICRILADIHKMGVIHRDIKPSNVLLDENGNPKLSDFGIAKNLTDEGYFTSSDAKLGTLVYMPPEQVRRKIREVDERSDIYAVGATLYELLTGQPPIIGESEPEIATKIVNEKPLPPSEASNGRSGIDARLDAICLLCLEKHGDDRYQTAMDLTDDLTRFLDNEALKYAHPRGKTDEPLPDAASNRPPDWQVSHGFLGAILFAAATATYFVFFGIVIHYVISLMTSQFGIIFSSSVYDIYLFSFFMIGIVIGGRAGWDRGITLKRTLRLSDNEEADQTTVGRVLGALIYGTLTGVLGAAIGQYFSGHMATNEFWQVSFIWSNLTILWGISGGALGGLFGGLLGAPFRVDLKNPFASGGVAERATWCLLGGGAGWMIGAVLVMTANLAWLWVTTWTVLSAHEIPWIRVAILFSVLGVAYGLSLKRTLWWAERIWSIKKVATTANRIKKEKLFESILAGLVIGGILGWTLPMLMRSFLHHNGMMLLGTNLSWGFVFFGTTTLVYILQVLPSCVTERPDDELEIQEKLNKIWHILPAESDVSPPGKSTTKASDFFNKDVAERLPRVAEVVVLWIVAMSVIGACGGIYAYLMSVIWFGVEASIVRWTFYGSCIGSLTLGLPFYYFGARSAWSDGVRVLNTDFARDGIVGAFIALATLTFSCGLVGCVILTVLNIVLGLFGFSFGTYYQWAGICGISGGILLGFPAMVMGFKRAYDKGVRHTFDDLTDETN